MSLQVWLPLNGNLNNQGLSFISTSSTATYEAGKIGQCLTASSNTTVTINWADLVSKLANGQEYTFTCWGKLTGNVDSGWIVKLGTNTCGLWWAKSAPRWVWNENDGGQRCANETISSDYTNWHHLAIVVTKTSTGSFTTKHYVDGAIADTYPGTTRTSSAEPTGTTITLYPYIARLNDVRIYDHALSAKEVKELAKGLVLHYKLDGGTSKIVPSEYQEVEYLQSSGTQYINTGYIANTFPLQLNAKMMWTDISGNEKDFWGNYNATSQSSSSYCFVCGKVNTTTWYQWGGNVWYPTSSLIANTLYYTSFTYTDTSGRTADINGVVSSSSNANTNALATTDGYIGLFAGAGARAYLPASVKIYSASIVHEGNMVRNFIPCYRISDNIAGMWDTITKTFFTNVGSGTFTVGPNVYTTEYDCSGYGYNGASIDTTLISKNDSSRYNNSLYFNGTTSGIIINNLNISNIINTAITYSFWIKPDGENGGRSVYFGSYNGTSWSIEKTAGNVLRLYWNGSPDISTTLPIIDGQWQHIVITKNGTSDIKIYLNGTLKQSITNVHNNLTFPTTYRIGRDVRENDGTPYHGLMSDFRIYATVLSADDILELYHTSASIGNDGTVYAYELEEV